MVNVSEPYRTDRTLHKYGCRC